MTNGMKLYRIILVRAPRRRERSFRYRTWLVTANNPKQAEAKVRAGAYRPHTQGYIDLQTTAWKVREAFEVEDGLFAVV